MNSQLIRISVAQIFFCFATRCKFHICPKRGRIHISFDLEQLAQDIRCVNNAMVARTGNHGKHCLGVFSTNRNCPRNKQGAVIWLNKNCAKCNIVFLYLLVHEAAHSYKKLAGLGPKIFVFDVFNTKGSPRWLKKAPNNFQRQLP